MDLGLTNAVAIVTGGASGIGAAIVETLTGEGANVVIFDVHTPDTSRFSRPELVSSQQLDLRDIAACRTAIEKTAAQFGHIDVLVNNAGVNDTVGLDGTTDAFVDSLQKNLVHYFTLTSACWPSLTRSAIGSVVNIGSKVATTGQGGTSGYAAAKGAVQGLTREWSVEGLADGVRVNTVIPAEVWTEMYERWLATRDDSEAAKTAIEQTIPLGHRFTTPEEIASTVTFLASPRSAHTTGQIIYVDGGYTHLDRGLTAR